MSPSYKAESLCTESPSLVTTVVQAWEGSPAAWVASVPTKAREDKWEVYSGQLPGLEGEQVLNLRVGVGSRGEGQREQSPLLVLVSSGEREPDRGTRSCCAEVGGRGSHPQVTVTCHCPGHAIPSSPAARRCPRAPYSLPGITNCLVTFPIL